MNDIIPAKPRSQSENLAAHDTRQPENVELPALNSQPNPPLLPDDGVQPKKPRRWLWLVAGLIALVSIALAGAVGWYLNALQPVDAGQKTNMVLKIEPGASPEQIATELDERGLIRSQMAFMIYTRLADVQGKLQTGSYRLSPSDSLPDIVKHLASGKTDEIDITFYPGATLYDRRDNIDDDKRTDVYTILRRAGFSDEQVKRALEKDYQHPLLADKPADASLEGYVYGDTYRFDASITPEAILEHSFDIFYQRIIEHDLINKFKDQNMSLHQGIILASIIEREVSGRQDDQKQVSQVFHLRLEKGMPLGADATFQYVAVQRNVAPSTTLDSPYNTRIHKGLPPGPISSPHINALQAAASPAKGDFLYFVSGDDGTTHFAHTDQEHQANTRKYCTTLCQQP